MGGIRSVGRFGLLPFAVGLVALSSGMAPSESRASAEPEHVQKTASRLTTRSFDGQRAFSAKDQVLQRPWLHAAFTEGAFHPIVREDGRVIGLVFEGWGTMTLSLPDGEETVSWQKTTDFAAWEQTFNAAYLRFSDSTLDDLQGERAWSEASDKGGAAFRIFESRTAMLETKDWSRWHPGLVTDQLMDLYGGGHVGGHLLAEFRLAESSPSAWLSYLHSPRGALLPGETTALYTARPRRKIPPELEILASFGTSAEAVRAYDIRRTAIDITFPTRGRNNRNLVDATATAELDLVALRQDLPLKAVELELAPRRLLCTGTSDRPNIRVSKVTDGKGRALAAVHRNGRLFIPLRESVQQGESLKLTIEYSGAMTQGIPARSPDTYFSELGPWAWYPRSRHIDRFESRVEVHLPRFMSAVAPGNLVETRKEKDGWHHVYEEQGGVRNLVLVVGDMVKTKDAEQGSNPRIIKWFGATEAKSLPGATEGTRKLVDLLSSIWGPYPYSTLHVVENLPYPGSNGTEEGSWSCVPPGQVHPWQSIREGGSGLLLSTNRTSAPARDVGETRALSRVRAGLQTTSFLRSVDLARQWWGHMVPERSYRDLWITEALATWTGLVFVQASAGEGALKERLQNLQAVAGEGSQEAPPLGVSGRLGSDFIAQVWARGPLIVNWLVQRCEAQVFIQAINAMINRASGPGLSFEVLVESMASSLDAETLAQLKQLVRTSELPEIEYNSSIDKDTGEVVVVFEQIGSPVAVDVTVEVSFGGKNKDRRMALLSGERTVFRWKPDSTPKKVRVDPMHTAIVRSLKKDKTIELTIDESGKVGNEKSNAESTDDTEANR